MTSFSADDVRAAIAAHLLGPTQGQTLGDIQLYRHQREGVERVAAMLAAHGGAMLADDVGLGKTYVALAVARGFARVIVIAPKSLEAAWRAAATAARVQVALTSVERLGRGAAPGGAYDLVIVDEAHHLRTATTKRFAAAATLCAGACVLLLSATPVQNRLDDLRTVLSLFLGERASTITAESAGQYLIRRSAGDVERAAALPRLESPLWLASIEDEDCLDRLLELPAAVPPSGGADGGVLLTYTLARQWASSRAALRGALTRRLARGHAMADALQSGTLPTRSELTAWRLADGVQQLSFPELITSSAVPDPQALLDQVGRHSDAIRELLAWLAATPDPDVRRGEALLALLRSHAGERMVAFSEYADTVMVLYRLLRPVARVAMLTHGGGRVAGGPISRSELLMRFAPGAGARVAECDRIDLLLTTDVLSEGVSLHDASVVLHLDLSWNPARLEQRVGRLRRIGASRDAVSVYLMPPPAPAERLLRMEQRLKVKLGDAARAVGLAGAILPPLTQPVIEPAPRSERVTSLLRPWRREAVSAHASSAAVWSPVNGALVCVRTGRDITLLGIERDRVVTAPEQVEQLVRCAGGAGAPLTRESADRVRAIATSYLRTQAVTGVVDLAALRVARSRRALIQRVDSIARRVPRHAQPQLAPLMRAARCAATATLSAGAERVLEELTAAPMRDEAWLHAVGEFASLHARTANPVAEILALLVLRVP